MTSAFLVALVRPLLYLFVWCVAVYWIAKLLYKIIPDGKVKRFLWKRRGLQHHGQRHSR